MRLQVVTPERVVLDEADVAAISAESVEGSFGVLPHHAPLVTPLKIGVLHYTRTNGTKEPMAVMGGIFQTNGQEAIILTDAAEKAEEIDVLRARQAEERAKAKLQAEKTSQEVQKAELAMARAMARLRAAKQG